MGVILIAFEREAELSALDQLLSGRGHKVVRSGNGLAALDAARREPPHAIVSDIVLPRMDGFALCRKWKQDERLQAIPFLFLHASPRRSEVRALRAGAGRRALPRALRAAGDAVHGARRAAGERGESERRNTGNTTPLPTLDETVIQRTDGAGQSAARCGSREGPAHRRAGKRAAQAWRRAGKRAAQARHRAGERAAQACRGVGERAAQADRSGRPRPTGARAPARPDRRARSDQQAARCRRSALPPRVRIESAADVDRGSRDRRFHRSQRRGTRVVRL